MCAGNSIHFRHMNGLSCESGEVLETKDVTPNLRIYAESSIHLSYQGQTFAVPCFWILFLVLYIIIQIMFDFAVRMTSNYHLRVLHPPFIKPIWNMVSLINVFTINSKSVTTKYQTNKLFSIGFTQGDMCKHFFKLEILILENMT